MKSKQMRDLEIECKSLVFSIEVALESDFRRFHKTDIKNWFEQLELIKKVSRRVR